MKLKQDLVRTEISLAKRRWCGIGAEKLAELRRLVRRYRLSVGLGDVLFIDTGWYVTHAGLLRLAHRNHCSGIKTSLEKHYSDPSLRRWVFKAIVYNSGLSKGFVGYGDADPTNVSSLVHGAEMRVAETRASTALSARPTASVFVLSKSLAGHLGPSISVPPSGTKCLRI